MDTAVTRRLEAAMKECGFCLAPRYRSQHAITIITPFIMPDGDIMDFYAAPKANGGWTISDFGDTAGQCLFTRGQTDAIPDSYKTEIHKVLAVYEPWHPVKFENGTLELETTDQRLPDALRHFAQMLLHVAHICSFGAPTELDTGNSPSSQQGAAASQ